MGRLAKTIRDLRKQDPDAAKRVIAWLIAVNQ